MGLLRRLLANWPLKLTSVLLAILLWIIAALEEPIGRRVDARLELDPPSDRVIVGAPSVVTVQLNAPAREFIKLGGRAVSIVKTVADSNEGVRQLFLSPADVILPRGVTARVVDVEPGQFPIRLVAAGSAAPVERSFHGVPVAVPGPVELRWLPVPDTVSVTLRGPAGRVATLGPDSVLVIAHPDTTAGAAALQVIVPAGFTAEARPAAIRLQPRRP